MPAGLSFHWCLSPLQIPTNDQATDCSLQPIDQSISKLIMHGYNCLQQSNCANFGGGVEEGIGSLVRFRPTPGELIYTTVHNWMPTQLMYSEIGKGWMKTFIHSSSLFTEWMWTRFQQTLRGIFMDECRGKIYLTCSRTLAAVNLSEQ